MSNEAKNTGGAAFPRTGEGFGNPLYDEAGMTLRDWFAGMAMTGVMHGHTEVVKAGGTPRGSDWLALTAYQIADAMLAERSK